MWKPPRRVKSLIVSVQSGEDHATLTFDGTLDDTTVEKAEYSFSKILGTFPPPKSILFICVDLTMISSLGLAFLINAKRVCIQNGIQLNVTRANGRAQKAIESIGLERLSNRLSDTYGVIVET